MIFAPHPDDDVIGCGGVIQHALAAGERVRIVFTTSGDGYPHAASVLIGKPVAHPPRLQRPGPGPLFAVGGLCDRRG